MAIFRQRVPTSLAHPGFGPQVRPLGKSRGSSAPGTSSHIQKECVRKEGKESHLLLHLHNKCLFIHCEPVGPRYILEGTSACLRWVPGKKAASAPRRAGGRPLVARRAVSAAALEFTRRLKGLGRRESGQSWGGVGGQSFRVLRPGDAVEQADVARSTLTRGVGGRRPAPGNNACHFPCHLWVQTSGEEREP